MWMPVDDATFCGRKHHLEIVNLIDSTAAAYRPEDEFDGPIRNIISDLDGGNNKYKHGDSVGEDKYSDTTHTSKAPGSSGMVMLQ